LAASCLPGRDAWFGLPRRVAVLREIGDHGQLGHCLRRQIRQAQHHGLDAGATKVSGFDPGSRPTQASVEAQDRSITLRPIRRLQDLADLGWRAHFAAGRAFRVPAQARQVYAAEGEAAVVAREARAASGGKPIRAL